MELKGYLLVLYRWIWLVALGTLAAMASSYLVFRYYTQWPPYEATATVMLIGDDTLGLDTVQAIRATYAELAGRRPVSQAVVDSLGLSMSADDLEELIKVNPVGYTRLLEISVTYHDAQQAAAIANEIARQLSEFSLSGRRQPARDTSARVITEARVPTRPGLGSYVGIFVAGFTGFTLTAGVVILIEYLGGKIRAPQDVERSLRLTVLEAVKYPRNAGQSTFSSPSLSETYQWICFRLCHLEGRSPQKLLITSPEALAGQSTLAAGLAAAWAETDHKAVLVNAHSISASQQQHDVLDDGMLDDLSRQANVVIVDGPPVLATPTAAILASKMDGVLLVLGVGKTRIKAAQETIQILEAVGGKILGTVLLSC